MSLKPLNIFYVVLQLLMDPLVLSVLYVWCQVNKDMIVQFWFGMQFKVPCTHLSEYMCNSLKYCFFAMFLPRA